MSRRKGARRESSDSDSESSDDGSGRSRHQVVQEAGYRSLELAAALRRLPDFAAAARELAACLKLYTGRCSKAAQALMLDDVGLAIDCCDT